MKKLIIISDEFREAVDHYRLRRGLHSWNAALLELASVGYRTLTLETPPDPVAQWGGGRTRAGMEVDFDRIEVQLRGLPPLADDD